jgi:osmotically-inducible protein OsmY
MAPQDQTAAGDGALRLAILTRLREDVGLPASAINATVSDGVVHLWGGVPSDAEKQAAVVAVWTVHGVRGLVDHVIVQSGSPRALGSRNLHKET